MKRSLLLVWTVVALAACSATDLAAPRIESHNAANTTQLGSDILVGGIDGAGMWAEPDPGDGWLSPLGRGGGWGMLPGLGGAQCAPAGQWATSFPNPSFPGIPGIQVTATANCAPDPFPSDDAILDWLRRVNAQRRDWAGAGWSPFAPGASPTTEEAQYCRARIGQAPTPEEFADIVEWAELACPPCWAALVLSFEAWGAWQTAGEIVAVGQRLLAEGMPCGRESVLMALGALATITKKVTGPTGQVVWAFIAPNDIIIGTKYSKYKNNLPGGIHAAEAMVSHLEILMGTTRRPIPNKPGTWGLEAMDGTNVNYRISSNSGPPTIGFSIPGKPPVKLKFP